MLLNCYECHFHQTDELFSLCSVMQFIPMPVLYGVFLYMGVASLNGVQVSLSDLLARVTFH